MYPIPSTEKLVETKTCRHCQASFPITDKDLEFYEKVSPVFPLAKGVVEDQGLSAHNPITSAESQVTPVTPGQPLNKGQYRIEGDKVRYLIPSPTLCPDCKHQRRLSFRNERKLYKRKCDATGKDIISNYSSDKPHKVYHQDIWWSDRWDPTSHGQDFDFSMSFAEQFQKLMRNVPQLTVVVTPNVENSPYTNYTDSSKDIYMCSDVFHASDVYYSTTLKYLENCCDCLDLQRSSHAYECSHSQGITNGKFIAFSENCSDSAFLELCDNVHKSLFCAGIKNKSYHLLNQPIEPRRYEELIKTPLSTLREMYGAQFSELKRQRPYVASVCLGCEDVIGDNLINCAQSSYIFDATNVQHAKYVMTGYDMDHIMDTCIHNVDCFYDYEAISGGKINHGAFNALVWGGSDLFYCFCVFDVKNLFGCIGLRNKSYCILNKQYTKEEYEELVPRIIEHMMKTGEWGEFFPSNLSPFGYNETVAQEYYPMTRDQILASPMRGGGTNAESTGGVRLEASEGSPLTPLHKGGESETFLHGPVFNWSDYEPPFPKVEKIIPASKLPQDIKDIPDDILNWAIECEVTKKPFRIIKQELEFYRKHNLPIPKRHPDQRHLDRMAQRNPRKLFERKCDCCHKDMITTYAPERPERVYCEECYNKEVIG